MGCSMCATPQVWTFTWNYHFTHLYLSVHWYFLLWRCDLQLYFTVDIKFLAFLLAESWRLLFDELLNLLAECLNSIFLFHSAHFLYHFVHLLITLVCCVVVKNSKFWWRINKKVWEGWLSIVTDLLTHNLTRQTNFVISHCSDTVTLVTNKHFASKFTSTNHFVFFRKFLRIQQLLPELTPKLQDNHIQLDIFKGEKQISPQNKNAHTKRCWNDTLFTYLIQTVKINTSSEHS